MKRSHAFTLIELTLVIALIGILASLAVPRVDRYACAARQVEAQSSLTALRIAEEAYFGDMGRYASIPLLGRSTTTDGATGLSLRGARRYRVWAEQTAAGFAGYAYGEPGSGVDGDLWRIDDGNRLVALVDVCRGKAGGTATPSGSASSGTSPSGTASASAAGAARASSGSAGTSASGAGQSGCGAGSGSSAASSSGSSSSGSSSSGSSSSGSSRSSSASSGSASSAPSSSGSGSAGSSAAGSSSPAGSDSSGSAGSSGSRSSSSGSSRGTGKKK